MKCEMCKQNPAEMPVKQVVDGQVKELFVCSSCATKTSAELPPAMPLADLLFSVGFEHTAGSKSESDVGCPSCGMTRAELKKRSRLGCPACYQAFAQDIEPMLRDMQGGDRHVGKTPAVARVQAELDELDRSLADAVRDQRFEQAAILRDRINELRGDRKATGLRETSP